MKFRWKQCPTNPEDTDLIVTMEDGRAAIAAFVRPVKKDMGASEHARTGWVARSLLGDFPDEDTPLPTKKAAMEKAEREFPAMLIGADQEKRDDFFD